MKLINLTANPSGAYQGPVTYDIEIPFDGHAVIPEDFDLSGFYESKGFAALKTETVEVKGEGGNILYSCQQVTSIIPDTTACKKWEKDNPALEQTESVTVESLQEEIKLLTAQNTALGDIAAFHEELIVELANNLYA